MAVVEKAIVEKLEAEFTPAFLEVVNESRNHNVPAGSESHFKVILAADCFEGLRRVARHRLVNKALSEELAGPIHALALHTMTPNEYFEQAGRTPDSPDCMGGETLPAN